LRSEKNDNLKIELTNKLSVDQTHQIMIDWLNSNGDQPFSRKRFNSSI